MSDPKKSPEEDPEAPEEFEEEQASGPTEEEWARRVLCSDEACIGVIGPDGRCKECGKPYEGELPEPAATGSAPASPGPGSAEAPKEDAEALGTEPSSSSEEPPDEEDEWKNRRLCSDGNCIGVIEPDGRCKECGKPFEGD